MASSASLRLSAVNAAYGAAALERSLAAQHRWLFGRVTHAPEVARVGRTAPIEGTVTDDASWVREGRLPAARRIEVYQHGYVERLLECLADDYPAVAHALGDVDFLALCLDFIESHPPRSASLNFFGAPFAVFCATWPAPFAAPASELARLEWAVVEAIHADASVVLDPAALRAIPAGDWAGVRLVPSPALRVLRTAYPVDAHYRAFLAGESPSLPEFEASIVAICRRGDVVRRVSVAPPFATLLSHLTGGLPLASALDALRPTEVGAAGAADLQRVLREWVACGFFASVAF
jgi:hypothetical protein